MNKRLEVYKTPNGNRLEIVLDTVEDGGQYRPHVCPLVLRESIEKVIYVTMVESRQVLERIK